MHTARWKVHLLAMPLLFATAGVAVAGWPPAGVPSGQPAWERPNFLGFTETNVPPVMPAATATTMYASPELYEVRVERYAEKHARAHPNTVLLVGHVPEHARVWIEGGATTQTGTVRQYESPPLTPNHEFKYRVRVDWMERGKPVSQTQLIPVKAGEVHTFYVHKQEAKDKAAAPDVKQ